MLSLVVLTISCRKELKYSDSPSMNISLSTDTIAFDTVFTCVGSATKILMVYNNNSENLKINSIRLERGSSSPYSINVDGQSGTVFRDKEIYAKDSLYVFVKVTIDPNDDNAPFFEPDQLIFNTNGNESVVKLCAYGQNANYIIGKQTLYKTIGDHTYAFRNCCLITDSVHKEAHWTSERPYVIYNTAFIDSDGTLMIDPGTRIYFHGGAGLWAWSGGQLVVNGIREEPVVFQGDRLESFYADQPGQWDRIWLMESRAGHGHRINHAIIRNGFIGLQIQRMLQDNLEVAEITNTIIENHTGMGLYANCYSIMMQNSVVNNCGNYCVALTGGGSYLMTHSTIANYWTSSTRQAEALFFNNLYANPVDGQTYYVPFECDIINSIVYGNRDNEFGTNFHPVADTLYKFKNSLICTRRPQLSQLYEACEFNKSPKFKNPDRFDFHLDTLSPAIGIGNPCYVVGELEYDLDGVERGHTPDAGAYQYIYVPER